MCLFFHPLNKVDILQCTILELSTTTAWENKFVLKLLHPVLICLEGYQLLMRNIVVPDLQNK